MAWINMKKLLLITFILLISACSQTPINNRYINANWQAIAIAPIEGKQANAVEMELDRVFAISDKVIVYTPDHIRLELDKRNLIKEYNEFPQKVMFELAKELKVDGVLFGQIKTSKTKNQFTGFPTTSLYSKLIALENKSVITATHHETSGFMASDNSSISELVELTVNDLNEALDQINPSTKKSWFEQVFN